MAAVAPRRPGVTLLETETADFFLVTSLQALSTTQVLAIDAATGALRFTGIAGIDEFATEAAAVAHLCPGRPRSVVVGRAILGLARLGDSVHVLLATKTRLGLTFPTGDEVHTITESTWTRIPLRGPAQAPTKAEAEAAALLPKFAVDGTHYFCETRDVSRPFPSAAPPSSPSREFAWNAWLAAPFAEAGLGGHCVVLMQGLAESRSLADVGGTKWVLAEVTRRSRLHAGMRYIARGLNAAAGPGNEAECEQILWRMPDSVGGVAPWSSYVWRRGTVPIWWGAEIKSSVSEAEIFVAAHRPYRGTARYFRRLQRRYRPTAGTTPPITCVNLLRGAMGKPEQALSEHMQQGVRQARAELGPGTRLAVVNFDWHAIVKQLGEPKAVEAYWATVHAILAESAVSIGTAWAAAVNGPASGDATVAAGQQGLVRFNCADSLDRTNLASFFGAVQVMLEQCRRLGLSVDTFESRDAAAPPPPPAAEPWSLWGGGAPRNGGANGGHAPGAWPPPPGYRLPDGWAAATDPESGKAYFVDHHRKRTVWETPTLVRCTPPGPEPAAASVAETVAAAFGGAGRGVDDLKATVQPTALTALAELFLLHGDLHAMLYTGSRAMHASAIHVLDAGRARAAESLSLTGALGLKGVAAASNLSITLQRRVLNVVFDASRQSTMEAFLGAHLPSSPLVRPLVTVSRPPGGCLLLPPQSAFPLTARGAPIGPPRPLVAIPGASHLDVYLWLAEPCTPRGLLMTWMHGAAETASPAAITVLAGQGLDTLAPVCTALPLPRCAAGTTMLVPLPGGDGPGRPLCRVLALRFFSARELCPNLIVGGVEVLGEIPGQGLDSQNAGLESVDHGLGSVAGWGGGSESGDDIDVTPESPPSRGARGPGGVGGSLGGSLGGGQGGSGRGNGAAAAFEHNPFLPPPSSPPAPSPARPIAPPTGGGPGATSGGEASSPDPSLLGTSSDSVVDLAADVRRLTAAGRASAAGRAAFGGYKPGGARADGGGGGHAFAGNPFAGNPFAEAVGPVASAAVAQPGGLTTGLGGSGRAAGAAALNAAAVDKRAAAAAAAELPWPLVAPPGMSEVSLAAGAGFLRAVPTAPGSPSAETLLSCPGTRVRDSGTRVIDSGTRVIGPWSAGPGVDDVTLVIVLPCACLVTRVILRCPWGPPDSYRGAFPGLEPVGAGGEYSGAGVGGMRGIDAPVARLAAAEFGGDAGSFRALGTWDCSRVHDIVGVSEPSGGVRALGLPRIADGSGAETPFGPAVFSGGVEGRPVDARPVAGPGALLVLSLSAPVRARCLSIRLSLPPLAAPPGAPAPPAAPTTPVPARSHPLERPLIDLGGDTGLTSGPISGLISGPVSGPISGPVSAATPAGFEAAMPAAIVFGAAPPPVWEPFGGFASPAHATTPAPPAGPRAITLSGLYVLGQASPDPMGAAAASERDREAAGEKPALARLLDEPPPLARTRVMSLGEDGGVGRRPLEILPAPAGGGGPPLVAGFQLSLPPGARRLTRPPAAVVVTGTAEDGACVGGGLGVYPLPVGREGLALCFDFVAPVECRGYTFEVVGGGDGLGGAGAPAEDDAAAWSLAGRVKLYRYARP